MERTLIAENLKFHMTQKAEFCVHDKLISNFYVLVDHVATTFSEQSN